MIPVAQRAVQCKVKGNLRDQRENAKTQCIFPHISCVMESLHQQIAKDRKSQSADQSHSNYSKIQCPVLSQKSYDSRLIIHNIHQSAVDQHSGQHHCSDMINQHRNDRNHLKCTSGDSSFLRLHNIFPFSFSYSTIIKYSLRSVNKRNSTLQVCKVQKTGFADKTCVTNDKKDLSR